MTAKRELTYRRPAHVEGGAAFLYYLSAELRADSRLCRLSVPQKWALLVAVEQHSDGAGVFYLSLKKWSAETGVSRRTLQRMTAKLETSGLLGVAVFAIGPARTNGQRSNTYTVDSALVERARTRGANPANHKGRQKRHGTRGVPVAPLNVSNVLNNARATLPADAGARSPRKFISPAEIAKREAAGG